MKNKSKKNKFFLIIVLLAITESLFLNTFGTIFSSNALNISKVLINDIVMDSINKSIKQNILKKYDIDNLIKINIINNKIYGVDYNILESYKLLKDIKDEINKSMIDYAHNIYTYKYEIKNNYLIIEIPFYSYKNNLLFANLGPKIETKINIIKNITGDVKTTVKTYGINALKVDLYLNFTINSNIVIPFKENEVITSFDILLASKIIEGEIPPIYNGQFENSVTNSL